MKIYHYLFIVVASLGVFIPVKSFASSTVKTSTKTNRNEVTREFDEIQNRSSFEANNNALREDAARNVGGGAMTEVFSPNEVLVGDLKGIDDMSLESRGLEAKGSEANDYFRENNFETDYTKPGAMGHKRDADDIVALTENKLKELTAILRQNGIDCEPKDEKTKEIEDPYYIEIETSEHKEVEYDPHFCEFPRNTYNCNDAMTIHCEKRNWKYYPWQAGEKVINVDGSAAYGNGWLYSIYWKKKRFGMHMRGDVGHGLKHYIAHHTGKNIGQIGDVYPPENGRGEGNISQCAEKEYRWDSYKVRYKYREAEEICDKWGPERWDERCSQRN